MSGDIREDTELLSDQLRREYWTETNEWWRIPGRGIAPRDPKDILAMLSDAEAEADVAKAELDKRQVAFYKARNALSAASDVFYKQERVVNVLKMALSDAVGIPK